VGESFCAERFGEHSRDAVAEQPLDAKVDARQQQRAREMQVVLAEDVLVVAAEDGAEEEPSCHGGQVGAVGVVEVHHLVVRCGVCLIWRCWQAGDAIGMNVQALVGRRPLGRRLLRCLGDGRLHALSVIV